MSVPAPDLPPRPSPAGSIHLDLASAYLASAAKVGSWAAITAMLYRYWGDELVAIFAFIRATLGVLAYVTLGIGPAMIHHLAQAARQTPRAFRVETLAESDPEMAEVDVPHARVVPLDYRSPPSSPRSWIQPPDPVSTLYANGLAIALVAGLIGAIAVVLYASSFPSLYAMQDPFWEPVAAGWVMGIGIGMVARLASDVPGAVIQSRGWIAWDNILLIAAEIAWVVFAWDDFSDRRVGIRDGTPWVGGGYAITGVLLFLARFTSAAVCIGPAPRRAPISMATAKPLLAFGVGVTLAQLADFLYAPIDFILINRLLNAPSAAAYLPAVQVDAALLLLVTAIAAVLLPRAATAHAGNDVALLHRYYVRGTLASLAILIIAAAVFWALSEPIFRLWLGTDAAATRAILPLLLIHTVIGGSSAVGRSILLGMGKVKPFTIAALLAGAANVVLSYCFVAYLDLGLRGIVLGTIIAVVGRCAFWQPWYVMRCLRNTPRAAV